MAFAAASKQGAPLAAGLLNNLRRLASPSSSSLLGPASVAATRRLYSTSDYYYVPSSSIGHKLVLHHQHLLVLLAPHFFFHHPMFFFTPTISSTPTAISHVQWWVLKQAEDAVEMKVAIPGLPRERVNVSANKKGLFIKVDDGVKGGGAPDDGGVQEPAAPTAPYSCHIDLSAREFELGMAKAEMKHGLLTLTVPRVKGIEIKIE